MKIALRLANSPEVAVQRPRPPVRRPALRAVCIAALVLLALAALLTVAAATDVIPVPQPVRDVMRRIGVETDASGDTPRRAPANGETDPHDHHNHLHPVAAQSPPGPETSELSTGELQGTAAPTTVEGVAAGATPSAARVPEDDEPAPRERVTPSPRATSAPRGDRQKDERDRKRRDDRDWPRPADDDR